MLNILHYCKRKCILDAGCWPIIGGCTPLGRGAGSPSNTLSPQPRPTCMPSFILIRPTVWPQCTNVTDRTHRTVQSTDNGPFYKRSPNNIRPHGIGRYGKCLTDIHSSFILIHQMAALVRRGLAKVCTVPVLLV